MGTERAPDERGRVGGLVLAAGRSRRFGDRNKLLANVHEKPVVTHATETVVESAVDEVVVIVGFEADRVGAALDSLPVDLRRNDEYEEGQSTSVATGVAAARERGWDAVVFALGDMPFVDVATVDSLVSEYVLTGDSIIAPAYQGRRGNPVLFGRPHFGALGNVEGDIGGRELVESHGRLLSVDDSGIHRDIDHPSDLDQ